MAADVSNPSEVQAVVDETIATYGRIDILVNNAGVTWGAEPEEMPLDKWQKVIDVNLTGAFLFSQAAGREMLKREYGRIINIASIAGLHGVGARAALRSVRGVQGRTHGPDARAGGVVGHGRHSRQRDRAGILPFPPGRSGASPLAEPSIKATLSDSPRRRGGRTQGRCVFLAV